MSAENRKPYEQISKESSRPGPVEVYIYKTREAAERGTKEGRVNLSSVTKKTETPEGGRYLGKPKAPGHPVFSLEARRATSPKRYGVPDAFVASKVRRRPRR